MCIFQVSYIVFVSKLYSGHAGHYPSFVLISREENHREFVVCYGSRCCLFPFVEGKISISGICYEEYCTKNYYLERNVYLGGWIQNKGGWNVYHMLGTKRTSVPLYPFWWRPYFCYRDSRTHIHFECPTQLNYGKKTKFLFQNKCSKCRTHVQDSGIQQSTRVLEIKWGVWVTKPKTAW